MYSARINGEPTTFGTSGLLSRSNKIMYDRATNSLWQQFTGEPVVGPLADSGIKLSFFPVLLTTWKEWAAEHPDTTVLSIYTGVYPRSSYRPESNPQAIYYDYFNSPDTMFPVPNRSPVLETKDVVLGLSLGDTHKAYPVEALQEHRIVNDVLGGTEIVVISSPTSQAARVYERQGLHFAIGAEGSSPDTMFPVPNRSPVLETKDVVLGLSLGDTHKAYPVEALQEHRIVNDVLGGTEIVVISSPTSQAARVYERQGLHFAIGAEGSTAGGLPAALVDSNGDSWQVTDDYLASTSDPSQRLKRLPTHMSFWFGWYSFHPDTLVLTQ